MNSTTPLYDNSTLSSSNDDNFIEIITNPLFLWFYNYIYNINFMYNNFYIYSKI